MFDIGMTELVLVAIVGLLVLGPERLPGAIRAVMQLVSKLKRSFSNIKDDLEREIGADEIREQLRNEAIRSGFEKDKERLTALDDGLKESNVDFLNTLIPSEEKLSAQNSDLKKEE